MDHRLEIKIIMYINDVSVGYDSLIRVTNDILATHISIRQDYAKLVESWNEEKTRYEFCRTMHSIKWKK